MAWGWAGRSHDAEMHRDTLREAESLRAENEVLDSKIDTLQDQLRRAHAAQDALSEDLIEAKHRADQAEAVARAANDTLRDIAHHHDKTMLVERREVEKELVSLRAENRELRTRADIAQNNFEWSRLMLNKSEEDRVSLMHHVLHVQMPSFALDRQQVVEPPAAAADATSSGIAAPVKDRAHEETAIGRLTDRFGVSFDDMGDDAAAREGLQHDNDGTVILAGR